MDNSVSYFFETLGIQSSDLEIVDLREREAPEPMEQVLLACANLRPGEIYLARLPHVPVPLFPHLKSRGLGWRVHEDSGNGVLLAVFPGHRRRWLSHTPVRSVSSPWA